MLSWLLIGGTDTARRTADHRSWIFSLPVKT
jgi:hypothetical protein